MNISKTKSQSILLNENRNLGYNDIGDSNGDRDINDK